MHFWKRIAVPCSLLVSITMSANADSWQMKMKKSKNKGQDQEIKIWVDEEFGLRITDSKKPDLEILIRTDSNETILIDLKKKQHAQLPDLEALTASLGDLIPKEARAALDERTKKGENNAKKTFEPTAKKEKIGKFETTQHMEFLEGEKTGAEFWLAEHEDWPKIASVFKKAMAKSPAAKEFDLPLAKLQGLPIRIIEKDGEVLNMVQFKKGKLQEKHMSPKESSKEVNILQMAGALTDG